VSLGFTLFSPWFVSHFVSHRSPQGTAIFKMAKTPENRENEGCKPTLAYRNGGGAGMFLNDTLLLDDGMAVVPQTPCKD
jgi:hypothetical protein